MCRYVQDTDTYEGIAEVGAGVKDNPRVRDERYQELTIGPIGHQSGPGVGA